MTYNVFGGMLNLAQTPIKFYLDFLIFGYAQLPLFRPFSLSKICTERIINI